MTVHDHEYDIVRIPRWMNFEFGVYEVFQSNKINNYPYLYIKDDDIIILTNICFNQNY